MQNFTSKNSHWNNIPWIWLVVFVAMIWMAMYVPNAMAVPSMARQTGYECSKCHTVFPELTPFGRQFKLGGYTMSSEKWEAKPLVDRIPVSATLQISATQTSNTTAGGAMPATDFKQDGNIIVQTAAIYYGGKITDNIGALIQYDLQYYNGNQKKRWGMDMLDARYANETALAGQELLYGVTLNNSPTISDIYNSTPDWRFPYIGTGANQMPAATLIDMTLASQVGGVGIYGMWNDLVYGELAVYRAANTGAFSFMGLGVPTNTMLRGNAPYWRLALQHEWGPHSMAVGTYGMNAEVLSNSMGPSLGSDRFRDQAFDANYQYIKGDNTGSVRATWIRENQEWNGSYMNNLVSNPTDTLNTLRVDLQYYFKRQWGGGFEYFKTIGSADMLRYNTGDPVMGSASGSPNSKGWIGELDYLPLKNIKLALRYTAFLQFNGASTGYMPGRNASDNNMVYLLGWFMF